MPDNLPPDTQQKPPLVQATTETPVEEAPKKEVTTEEQKQSTREWLQSLGIVEVDVATRERSRVEREAARVEAPPPREEPTRRVPGDVEEVRHLLKEGDDASFIEGVVNLSRKRVLTEIERTNRDAQFGQEVSQYVQRVAPDVPLVVFWAYGQEAERRFPGAVDRQIDWAIGAGRKAMETHNAQVQERTSAIRDTQEQSDTLDGTPARPRRRGAREQEPRATTFVEELLEAQRQRE